MKYIMVKIGFFKMPIVFPDTVRHRTVAQAFNPSTVVSAGFVNADDPASPLPQKSTSLKMGPADNDAAILEAFLSGEEALIPVFQDEAVDNFKAAEADADDSVLAALFNGPEEKSPPLSADEDLSQLNTNSP